MAISTDILIENALMLPVEERARLVEELLKSLGPPLDPQVESAWEVEAERRRQAVLSGEDKAVPYEEAMARLRARHAE